jgi:Protein of unknown function (DUF1566)
MEEEEMLTTRKRAQGRSLRALTTILVLALLAALLLAGTALAAAKPGRPTAKAPRGAITQAKPTFKWSKAARAAKYEVRVYKGSKLLLKKTGITKRSWKSSTALPENVSLTWKVRARNAAGNGAWSKRLKLKVVTAPGSTKAITAFSFSSPAATGSINESAHAIALTVPFGTNVTALVATFTTTGASVAIAGTSQTSGLTANNFSNPVTYRVTAANASTQDYAVTVTVASSPAKAITAFSFSSPAVTGSINESAHTIALTVPFGANVTALAPTITITGASVSPASGVANNFTGPRTYRVTAADASTQDYTVTVTVAAAVIGQSYGGGVIAYILQSGDPGYVAGETRGLIAATVDQSTAMPWWNGNYTITGATATELGTGFANTDTIISLQGDPVASYAAGLARAYRGGGYTDWYLPSKDELNTLFINRAAIGGFDLSPGGSPMWGSGPYWSSSEYPTAGGIVAEYAWAQYFSAGAQIVYPAGKQHVDWKSGPDYRVRAVRSF